jgi:hypothetical protein
MMILTMLLVGAGLVVQTADRVPNLDVKSIAANKMAGPTGRTVESCLVGETAARKDLERDRPSAQAASTPCFLWATSAGTFSTCRHGPT